MPYSTYADLPARTKAFLKNIGASDTQIRQWIHVFNSCKDSGHDDGRCFREANSVVSRAAHSNFLAGGIYDIRLQDYQGPYGKVKRIPAILTREGVQNGYFKDYEEIKATAWTANGIPVTDGHPIDRMSGSRGDISNLKGFLSDAHADDSDRTLKANVNIFDTKDNQSFIKDIESGKKIDGSVGFFADEYKVNGEYKGVKYIGVETNLVYEHYAILPKGHGACSQANGCGLGLNMVETKEDLHEGGPYPVGYTMTDCMKSHISEALSAADPASVMMHLARALECGKIKSVGIEGNIKDAPHALSAPPKQMGPIPETHIPAEGGPGGCDFRVAECMKTHTLAECMQSLPDCYNIGSGSGSVAPFSASPAQSSPVQAGNIPASETNLPALMNPIRGNKMTLAEKTEIVKKDLREFGFSDADISEMDLDYDSLYYFMDCEECSWSKFGFDVVMFKDAGYTFTPAWGSINKSQLPMSSFMIVGDPKLKSTWKLPYKTAGGTIHCGAIRAIRAVLAGARGGVNLSPEDRSKARAAADSHWAACQRIKSKGDELISTPSKIDWKYEVKQNGTSKYLYIDTDINKLINMPESAEKVPAPEAKVEDKAKEVGIKVLSDAIDRLTKERDVLAQKSNELEATVKKFVEKEESVKREEVEKLRKEVLNLNVAYRVYEDEAILSMDKDNLALAKRIIGYISGTRQDFKSPVTTKETLSVMPPGIKPLTIGDLKKTRKKENHIIGYGGSE